MNTIDGKIRSYVGFAIKSGKCDFGLDNILVGRHVSLVLYSNDMSKGSISKLKDFANEKSISIYEVSPERMLFITQNDRIKAVGIRNKNLSRAISDCLSDKE